MIRLARLLSALAVAGLAGALGLSEAQAQPRGPAPGGFYRQANMAAVMFQYAPDRYCQVQNEAQMAAYGGFSRVRVVPYLQMWGRPTGACGWPNGFYRRANETAVWQLGGPGQVGNMICHVRDERQMMRFGGFGQVWVVPPGSDLSRGRSMIGGCPG